MKSSQIFVLSFGAFFLLSSLVEAQEKAPDRVSVQLGIPYQVLGSPKDVPGAPTFLSGSAFSGFGVAFGGSYTWQSPSPWVAVEGGLMLTQTSIKGEEGGGDVLRRVTLDITSVRAQGRAKTSLGLQTPVRPVLGGGLDLLWGITSAAEVEEFNIPEEQAFALETVSVVSMQFSGQVGVEIDMGPLVLPILLQGSINPFVGQDTKERFKGFEGFGDGLDPGAMRMEWGYEVLFLMGVAYKLPGA